VTSVKILIEGTMLQSSNMEEINMKQLKIKQPLNRNVKASYIVLLKRFAGNF